MFNILFPTDGSERSQQAMKQGMAFAKALGAKVIGLHVVPSFHMPRDEGDLLPTSAVLKERIDEEHKAKARQILVPVEAEAKSAGVECESIA